MGLPVIQHKQPPSDQDLLRLFHHAESRYVEPLANTTPLDVGTAYSNPKLPAVYDANHIRDVALPVGMRPEEAMQIVESHFARCGTRCAYWVMNQPYASQTQPMVEHLLSTGHSQARADVMLLRHMPNVELPVRPGLTIIPARASYRHVRQLAEESARDWGEPQLVEAAVLHLDDPQWSEMLALKDDKAVARIGALAVGDVGRIDRFYVARPFRGQGIGRLMLLRILELCVRTLFRHVMVSVHPDNAAALKLYREFGFETIGRLAWYASPGVKLAL